MSPWRLVFGEILFRKLHFFLSVFAVAAAAAVLAGAVTSMRRFDAATQAILARKEAETQARVKALRDKIRARVAKLNDEMRRIMKKMGFNILILPEGQDLTDYYSKGYAAKLMPESYVEKLSKARIMTIRHLMPILERRVSWPEQGGRTVFLVGTRGEVPQAWRKNKKTPIVNRIPKGKIVLGYQLWKGLHLKPGDKVAFMGRTYTVDKCMEERGSKDDISLWLPLEEAQSLLGLRGKINAILALECSCAWAQVGKVRADVARVLPGTQVKEFRSKALARAEARNKAAAEGARMVEQARREMRAALLQEKAARAKMKQSMDDFASILVPLVLLASTLWTALLAFDNVRRRRGEIGILRAIGCSSGRIASLFLARAVLVGIAGALAGYAAGVGGALQFSQAPPGGPGFLQGLLFLGILLGAPLLSALAGLAPAALAARTDPALVLREE